MERHFVTTKRCTESVKNEIEYKFKPESCFHFENELFSVITYIIQNTRITLVKC